MNTSPLSRKQLMEYRKFKRQVSIELFGQPIGCHDLNCVYGHPGGMHTNGGCKCNQSKDDLIKLINELIKRLANQ